LETLAGDGMKILVTGGTGFIGSHLVKKLVKNGDIVRCLVRENSKTDFLKSLGVELVIGDVTKKESLKNVAQEIDVVYNLAAIVDHKHKIPYQYHYNVNVIGTKNMVEECIEHNIKKFVYYSSIATIGVRNNKTLMNETIECKSTTPYGKAKLETERLLLDYFKNSNFPVNILRPPVVYGHGSEDGVLSLTKFIIERGKRNQPYPFIGHGKNLVSLCYVENLVDATILAGNTNHVGEIYHIADARPYTINEYVKTIADVLEINLREMSIPKFLMSFASFILEPLKRVGLNTPLYRRRFIEMTANFAFDISKAKNDLGYNPGDNFRDYMKEAIDWYKERNLL
jgi:nucleoside-diphosphate-sugar epimerase